MMSTWPPTLPRPRGKVLLSGKAKNQEASKGKPIHLEISRQLQKRRSPKKITDYEMGCRDSVSRVVQSVCAQSLFCGVPSIRPTGRKNTSKRSERKKCVEREDKKQSGPLNRDEEKVDSPSATPRARQRRHYAPPNAATRTYTDTPLVSRECHTRSWPPPSPRSCG